MGLEVVGLEVVGLEEPPGALQQEESPQAAWWEVYRQEVGLGAYRQEG